MIIVSDLEGAVAVSNGDAAVFERPPELFAEHREQNLICKVGFWRPPVDIEEIREAGTRSILKHVEPPFVRGVSDAHMVRHRIDDDAHAVLACFLRECAKPLRAADFPIEPLMIRHVVAVAAAGSGLHDRRNIMVADAEAVEVLDYFRRLEERKFAVELQAIGGGRDACARGKGWS